MTQSSSPRRPSWRGGAGNWATGHDEAAAEERPYCFKSNVSLALS